MIRFLLILSLFPVNSFALIDRQSGSGGNGGQSVICGSAAESFDLFEGAKLFSYAYGRNGGSDALQNALQITAELDALSPGTSPSFSARLKRVAGQMVVDTVDAPLDLTTDIAETVLPAGCSLEQVVVFFNPSYIRRSAKPWSRLSVLSQTALYLHETLYWYLRDSAGENNSRRTRRIVSYLLGGGAPALALRALGAYDATPVYCSGRGGLTGSGSIHMYLLVDPAGQAEAMVLRNPDAEDYGRYPLGGGPNAAALVKSGFLSYSGELSLASELLRQGGDDLAFKLRLNQGTISLEEFQDGKQLGDNPLECERFESPLP